MVKTAEQPPAHPDHCSHAVIHRVKAPLRLVDVRILLLEGHLRPADDRILPVPGVRDGQRDDGAPGIAVRAARRANAAAVADDDAEALALRDVVADGSNLPRQTTAWRQKPVVVL